VRISLRPFVGVLREMQLPVTRKVASQRNCELVFEATRVATATPSRAMTSYSAND